MIVITDAEFQADEDRLVLRASWLDGSGFRYVISNHGIEVHDFDDTASTRSRQSIRSFILVVHQDVWTLLVRWRFEMLWKSWQGVRRFLTRRPIRPLSTDEIGTAFGLMPAWQVAKKLRDWGYQVEEIQWSDMLEQDFRTAPAP